MKTIIEWSPACKVYIYDRNGEYVCGGCLLNENRIWKSHDVEKVIEHIQDHRDHDYPVPKSVEARLRLYVM